MSFFLLFHSLWCRTEKYKEVSECLQNIILESKYDRNPSFIIRLQNKYDRNTSFCDIVTFLRVVCYRCYDRYTLIPWLVPLFSVCTGSDVTISLVCSNQRYNQCACFEPTLRSVFLTSTDVTIGDIDFNRQSVLSTYGPITNVTIDILGSWPPLPYDVDSTFKL